MPHTPRTTIDEVIKSLLSQEGKSTPHDYMVYLNLANIGLKELTFDILGNTSASLLLVSSVLRIDLPENFVDYTFIGVVGNDGRKHTLGSAPNIAIPGGVIPDVSDAAAEYIVTSGFGMGGIYGLGGGQNSNGYYRPEIDVDNWQMILAGVQPGSYIYLEYITDGSLASGENIIHPYAEEALRAYIYWKSIQRKRYVGLGEKADAKTTYYNEKRLARKRLVSFTKEEALQQIRKGFKQSPKL